MTITKFFDNVGKVILAILFIAFGLALGWGLGWCIEHACLAINPH